MCNHPRSFASSHFKHPTHEGTTTSKSTLHTPCLHANTIVFQIYPSWQCSPLLLSRCRHKCSFFRKAQSVADPVQTHRFAREVQSHTFPARCGATTGCSLDSRGKAVRPAQIKQLTSASTSSQYVTNATRLTAK